MTTKTTTKQRRKPSKKSLERRAAFRAMAEQLSGELKEGKHTEKLAKAARQVQGLERYSELNQLLILTQCPHATDVDGYVAWQKRGYQVQPKQPGIAIRAPHEKKPTEGQEDDEEGRDIGFHRTYVWDISQVAPIDGAQAVTPAPDEEEPEAAPRRNRRG